ncbi:MAG: hypothetical protein H5U40_16630 [Polyangiaceae bacterium]|nr:hypothetical protein [Polyangiaceae bacterium]
MRSSFFLFAVALSWALLPLHPAALADDSDVVLEAGPDPDRWVLQGGGRLVSGFGSSLGEGQEKDFIMELGLRGDMLFGRPGNRNIRIGPTFEFRTGHFHTVEYAAGAMALFPTAPGWPIQLSVLGGYAHRFNFDPTHDDGAVLVTNLAYGYRSFNHFARYGVGVNFYVSGRVHLDNTQAYEITGGLEFDLALAFFVPVSMVRMAATEKGDPDEYQ